MSMLNHCKEDEGKRDEDSPRIRSMTRTAAVRTAAARTGERPLGSSRGQLLLLIIALLAHGSSRLLAAHATKTFHLRPQGVQVSRTRLEEHTASGRPDEPAVDCARRPTTPTGGRNRARRWVRRAGGVA